MILAIDTVGPRIGIALGEQGGKVESSFHATTLNHNELLANDEIIELAGDRSRHIKSVAVTIGPGSFTGTRVGVSFAIGWAQEWQNLYAISRALHAKDDEKLKIIVEATSLCKDGKLEAAVEKLRDLVQH